MTTLLAPGESTNTRRVAGVRKFRPDIEGLRAVAVVVVVLAHAGLALPGGYIGVSKPALGAAPGTNQEWVYATGPIDVRRSEIFTAPDTRAEALDRLLLPLTACVSRKKNPVQLLALQ